MTTRLFLCARAGKKQEIPIVSLPPAFSPPEGWEWIAAYCYWRRGSNERISILRVPASHRRSTQFRPQYSALGSIEKIRFRNCKPIEKE